MEKYIVVLCQASLIVINEFKKKGHLTPKEKLHTLQFLFFMFQNFTKDIYLEQNTNQNRIKNNIIFGRQSVIDTPQEAR